MTKLFIAEPESDGVQRIFVSEPTLVSSQILRVELVRALRRADLAEETIEAAKQTVEKVNLRRISDEILARAAVLTPRGLRTLDAIHLATALDLSPPPEFFLCYDQRLGDAARAHGLRVLSPAADEVHEG